MSKRYVLDTSAIFTLTDAEEGAEQVESLLEAARANTCQLTVCSISLEGSFCLFIVAPFPPALKSGKSPTPPPRADIPRCRSRRPPRSRCERIRHIEEKLPDRKLCAQAKPHKGIGMLVTWLGVIEKLGSQGDNDAPGRRTRTSAVLGRGRDICDSART